MIKPFYLLVIALLSVNAIAQPTAPTGKKWVKQNNLSDEFNNGFNDSKWTKPLWNYGVPVNMVAQNSGVSNGNLWIKATLNNSSQRWFQTSRVMSKAQIKYPMYTESRIRTAHISAFNTFWLNNGDINNRDEIDVIENNSKPSCGCQPDFPWQMNSQYFHVVNGDTKRNADNFDNRNLSNSNPLKGVRWNEDYHVVGVWWKDAKNIQFYLNGEPAGKVVSARNFTRNLNLIWDLWTADANYLGGLAVRSDLNNNAINTMYVDWVHTYKLVDDDGANNGGGRVSVPAKIEAENYANFFDTTPGNAGGQFRNDNVDIQSTTDANGGYNIGWIDGNEWLEYPISVTRAGEYRVDTRVASQAGNGMFSIEVDGVTRGDTVAVGDTGGWQNWQTKSTSIGRLSPGNKTLRVQVQAGNFNLNWLDVVRTGNGGAVDQCDTTLQCRNIFGNRATDCRDSQSNTSVCMCGSSPCN
ncbi:carbohydrate-binding protein [Agarilytica rhodophyticola]|uniref:carbohydrate-binding protein n=1 Tax=Agarilytica rhodophyticola TaxID=1737490 RepID=UPI000B346D2E|nr:carbohydrate-binding protein [Agarilytica rhodophyticola]